MNLLRALLEKAVKGNPVFGLMLGLCPTLAVTTSVQNALAMSAAVLAVLLCSNILISLIARHVPREIRIACYIVVIAGFVSMVEILMNAVMPDRINRALGIFIPLIVVNCIILGRAEAFACRNTVVASMGDAIGVAIGFAGSLVMISLLRETLGSGTLWGYSLSRSYVPATLGIMAPGAFLVIGLLFGLFNAIGNWRKARQTAVLEPVKYTVASDAKPAAPPKSGGTVEQGSSGA